MPNAEAFILILATGLRIGEILALTWDDIDFKNCIININKIQVEIRTNHETNTNFHIEYGTPKTKSSFRNIHLIPIVIQLLKEVKEKQVKQMEILSSIFQDNNLIFCNFEGKAIYSKHMRVKFKKMIKKLGIDGIHIHCLRHTFATRGLENGIEL